MSIKEFQKNRKVLEKYNGNSENVVIPEGIKTIGHQAFFKRTNLKSVVIPEGVTEIESELYTGDFGCFNGCKNLQSVTLPSTLEYIGKQSFKNCESIRSIDIPENVRAIDAFAFEGCKNLKSIVLSRNIYDLGACAFRCCSALESVEINGPVDTFSFNLFDSCINLKSIAVAEGTTRIEEMVFHMCKSLKKVILPDSLRMIGKKAFYGCNSLIFNEYEGAFYLGNDRNPYVALIKGNKRSADVKIHERCVVIADGAFIDCWELKSVSIPESIVNIPPNAFSGCIKLESITIPSSINEIGKNAFKDCTALKRICLPEKPNLHNSICFDIGENAFENCARLEEITFPATTLNINCGLCKNCKSLKRVIIPEGIVLILDSAFKGCVELERIDLPASMESIWKNSFCGCKKLVVYGIKKESIKDKTAFDDCAPDTLPFSFRDDPDQRRDAAIGYLNGKHRREDEVEDMIAYIQKTKKKLLEYIVNQDLPTALSALFDITSDKQFALEDIDTALANTCINVETNSLLLDYKNKHYSKEVVEKAETVRIDKALGTRELDVSDWKKIYTVKAVDGGYELSNYKGDKTEVEVPGIIAGRPVVSLSRTFLNKKVTVVKLPASVKIIGERTFKNCSDLKEIVIPGTLTYIGEEAFLKCSSLTEIVITGDMLNIGKTSFEGCENIKRIVFKGSIDKIDLAFDFYSFGYYNPDMELFLPTSINSIGERFLFPNGPSVVYYEGTPDQWKNIKKSEENINIKFKLLQIEYNVKY